MGTAIVPHLALPFRIDADGSAAVVEQDTPEDVLQCVEVIVRTPRGFRIELLDFGVPDQVFVQTPPDRRPILAAIEQWEPRAVADMEAGPADRDALITEVLIRIEQREA